jgi:hypothetical protein
MFEPRFGSRIAAFFLPQRRIALFPDPPPGRSPMEGEVARGEAERRWGFKPTSSATATALGLARAFARLAAQGIATLRLPASLILRDVDDAVRTIMGYLQHGDRSGRGSRCRAAWTATPSDSLLRSEPPPPPSGSALGEDLRRG